MIRTRDGRSPWSDQFDETFSDLFTVEDAISRSLAAKLEGFSNPGAPPTKNGSAYQNYLRGRYLAKQFNAKDFEAALGYFHEAIHDDPVYALAYQV